MEKGNNMEIPQKLINSGVENAMAEQYRSYLKKGDRQGQVRILHQCSRMQKEKLKQDRECLACLDYMIAKVEKTCEE